MLPLDAAFGESRGDFELFLEIESNPGKFKKISGYFHLNLRPGEKRCFYTPYNSKSYGEDFAQQRLLDILSGQSATTVFSGGTTEVRSANPKLDITSLGAITQITAAADAPKNLSATVHFESQPPRLTAKQPVNLVDGFYPHPLVSCPESQNTIPAPLKTFFHVNIHDNSHALVSNLKRNNEGAFFGQSYKLVLATSDLHKKTITTGPKGARHTVYYKDKSFLDYAKFSLNRIKEIEDHLGEAPFQELTFFEPENIQSLTTEGLIAISLPRQAGSQGLQGRLLNWNSWLFLKTLIKQWLGASTRIDAPNHQWFFEGLAEYVTHAALAKSRKQTLFATDEGQSPLINATHLEILEIAAATLTRFAPFSRLTNRQLVSPTAHNKQHPLIFVRHFFALRQIAHAIGEARMRLFLKNFYAFVANKTTTPKDFYQIATSLGSAFSDQEKHLIKTALLDWWQSYGWPDFAVTETQTRPGPNGTFVTSVKVSQKGSVDFAPSVTLVEKDVAHTQRAHREKEYWSTSFTTASLPQNVEVDKQHESFDLDRFNNSQASPDIYFLPGSANKLHDNAYTVVWFPYPFRHAGEPFSLGLNGAIFKYLNSGSFFRLAWAPSTNDLAGSLRQKHFFDPYALSIETSLSQNYDKDRLGELSVSREPVFKAGPTFGLKVAARAKERPSLANSRHITALYSLSLKDPRLRTNFFWLTKYENEFTPQGSAKNFTYKKQSGSLKLRYQRGKYSGETRFFRGFLQGSGDVPDNALYKLTDASNARMRIDVANLGRVEDVTTLTSDFLTPVWLPLSKESYILEDRMRLRILYDVGYSDTTKDVYRSAGAGFFVPFGGDLGGSGSLSLIKLSILGIFYTQTGDDVSLRPSYLLDLSGEL